MTDRALGKALAGAVLTEASVRAQWEAAVQACDEAERVDALAALREVIAFKRSLERWILARSQRAVTT